LERNTEDSQLDTSLLVKQNVLLYLSSIYTHFYACATSVDPDQLAHLCRLIWICTGRILVKDNLMNQKANSLDPDQMAWMCRLIGI
jgi:hypothetical protein